MKKLLTILLIGIGFFAKAQQPTIIPSYHVYAVPTDTFQVPNNLKGIRAFFAIKGEVPYMWSIPQQKWIPLPGGGGGGAVSSVFGRTGVVAAQVGDYSAFYYPLASNPAGYLTGTTGYTKTQINSFFGGTTPIGGYNKTNWDAAFSWGNHTNLYPTITRFTDSLAAHWAAIMAGGGGGGGTGDMTKAIYDTDNDGIVDNSELLAGQNTAYYLARANHTGTQAISTITGLQTALDAKQALLNGTGLVRMAGTTVSYDNTAYTPTSRLINGQALTSNITLTSTNIAEGTNLYYTDPRVQAVIDANTFSFRNSQYSNGITLLHSLGASSALFKKLYFTGGGVTVTPVGDSAYVVDIASGGGGGGGDMYLAGVQTVTGQKTFTAETIFQGNIKLGASSDGIITVPTGEGLKVSNGSINSSIIKPFGIHTYFQNIEGAGNFYYTGPSGTTSTGRVIYNTAGVDIDGTLKLGSVANDNTETNILVWNSTDKVLEYRTVASLPGGGSHVHNASTDITTGTLPIARGGTGLGTIGTAGQTLTVAPGGTTLQWGGLDASQITGVPVGGILYGASGGSIGSTSAFTYNPTNGRAEVTGSYPDYNGFSVTNTNAGTSAFSNYIGVNNVGTVGSFGVGGSTYTYVSGRNRTSMGGYTGVTIMSNSNVESGGTDDVRIYVGGRDVAPWIFESDGQLYRPDGTVVGGSGGGGTAPTITTSSSTSLTLTVTGSYIKTYIFTGASDAVWTLPAIGTTGQIIKIKNKGTGDLTIQRAGSNKIFSDAQVNSVILYTGDGTDFQDDGTDWNTN